MKFNIFAKLFTAVLLATMLIIVFMVVFMNWSFRQGFAKYQRESELENVRVLAQSLATEYQQQQSWSFLRNNPRDWQRLLLPLEKAGSPELQALRTRIRLRDVQNQFVIGLPPRSAPKPVDSVPITVNDKVRGWLELEQKPSISDEIARSFMEQQARNIYLIALFAALLSLLVTWVVVRQLLIPVQRLTEGAKLLAQGEFTTRIDVTSQDELGELASRFNQLSEFLHRNQELRGQWVADISHELRTPLAVLRSETEALLDGIRQPTPERIRSLHTDILSLGQLVDDLYQLSLSDAGEIELSAEPVDLTGLLQDVLRIYETRLQEKHIRLSIEVADNLWIQGDEKRLYQLLSNLLENSYRYTDENGQVQIRAQQKQQQIIIEVADTKPGVPDTALTKLFDRLYRVDRSRSRVMGGSGLGLSICQNIVNMHQGSISATHSRHGGLSINITFPLMTETRLTEKKHGQNSDS